LRQVILLPAQLLLVLGGCGEASDREVTPDSVSQEQSSKREAESLALPPEEPRTITIVTPDDRARLCPQPDCGQKQELGRLPTGVVLEIRAERRVRLPQWDVIWFQVSYEGRRGWVSEFETDLTPQTPRYR
jgi:hypothetical protein